MQEQSAKIIRRWHLHPRKTRETDTRMTGLRHPRFETHRGRSLCIQSDCQRIEITASGRFWGFPWTPRPALPTTGGRSGPLDLGRMRWKIQKCLVTCVCAKNTHSRRRPRREHGRTNSWSWHAAETIRCTADEHRLRWTSSRSSTLRRHAVTPIKRYQPIIGATVEEDLKNYKPSNIVCTRVLRWCPRLSSLISGFKHSNDRNYRETFEHCHRRISWKQTFNARSFLSSRTFKSAAICFSKLGPSTESSRIPRSSS